MQRNKLLTVENEKLVKINKKYVKKTMKLSKIVKNKKLIFWASKYHRAKVIK